MNLPKPLVALAAALAASAALADINVGVTVSATGPAASLGIPEKNTIALMPQTIAGHKVTVETMHKVAQSQFVCHFHSISVFFQHDRPTTPTSPIDPLCDTSSTLFFLLLHILGI